MSSHRPSKEDYRRHELNWIDWKLVLNYVVHTPFTRRRLIKCVILGEQPKSVKSEIYGESDSTTTNFCNLCIFNILLNRNFNSSSMKNYNYNICWCLNLLSISFKNCISFIIRYKLILIRQQLHQYISNLIYRS